MKYKILFILIFIGCNINAASNNMDFKAGSNSEEKIYDGLYRITHKAPRLLFSAAPSWKGLNKRAETLCGRKDYLLIDKKQIIVGQITEITREEFLVEAHLICDPQKMTEEEAKKIMSAYYSPPVVIDESLLKNCIESKEFNKEEAYKESKR